MTVNDFRADSRTAEQLDLELLESTAWPTLAVRGRRTLEPTVAEPLAAFVRDEPVAGDRVLALQADRDLAIRQLAGYSLPVARRFGLNYEESVPPATGSYRVELLEEIARIDGELARRSLHH